MKDHDVKKVVHKFQQIPPARPSTIRDINSSTPLFIEPQISRNMNLGCFIGHPLTQNNNICWKRMPKYSSFNNDYADTTEQMINTNQLVVICCSTKECYG